MIKLIATGIPENIEQYQLALDAAFAAGKAIGKTEDPFMALSELSSSHTTASENTELKVGFKLTSMLGDRGVICEIAEPC